MEVTSATSATSDSAATSNTTGGEPLSCGDDPPNGYLGDANPACESKHEVGMFNPVVEWKKAEWEIEPASNQVAMQPIVARLDDDEIPDILFVTSNPNDTPSGILRAISGDGQIELLSIAGQGIYGVSGLAAGDIDGDGRIEIIANGFGNIVKAFEHDGALKWTSPSITGHMELYGAPAIADLDGDGSPEIIMGRAILNADGSIRGTGEYGTGSSPNASVSFAADLLNNDGIQEVVVGDALYDPDGNAYWHNGEADGLPGVADFNLDGEPEIVVVSPGAVRLQSALGVVLWNVVNPALGGGPPTVADFDGDGEPEIGVAGKTGYIVFDGDGSVLWQNLTQDASSGVTGSSVYDFEGDGIADVVYADEINLYVYSGLDGTVKLQHEPHSSATAIEYPVVADVDNDGQVEIVVAHNNVLIAGDVGITVLGDMDKSWRPGRKIWNQHAYSITNVNDDGTIPAPPEPSWLTHNTFRSGDLSESNGLAAPDLVMLSPESCLNECSGANQVEVWVQLGNAGAAPLTAGATIEVYGISNGVESLLQQLPVDIVLQPGEYADAMSIEVDVEGVDELRLVALPNEAECIVDSANELSLMAPFCVIPG